jgi:hypothetical protein
MPVHNGIVVAFPSAAACDHAALVRCGFSAALLRLRASLRWGGNAPVWKVGEADHEALPPPGRSVRFQEARHWDGDLGPSAKVLAFTSNLPSL